LKEIIEGIELFNKEDFFAAHDFFEECWLECESKEKLFYQGLVQVAVGCYHLISGNNKGSLSQFKKGIRKLKGYSPSYKKVNLSLLIEKLEPLIKNLSEIKIGFDPKKFWNCIPRIEIIN
jgi:uncharacterized protein